MYLWLLFHEKKYNILMHFYRVKQLDVKPQVTCLAQKIQQ